MKKTIGAIALVLAVFSMLYLSNTSYADKAALKISPSTEVTDVSNGDTGNFTVVDMTGFSSVSILARIQGSGSAFAVVGPYNNVVSAGNYTRSALQLQTQFGNGTLEWKIKDNSSASESTLAQKTIQD